jgi:hypothetical protein
VDKEGVVEGLGELIIELGFIIEPGSTTKRSAVVRGASTSTLYFVPISCALYLVNALTIANSSLS